MVVASNERISSSSFGRSMIGAPFRSAPPPRVAVHSSSGAEVVDVAEDDVVHRVAVGDRDRDREERDAALRVQRAVDRVDDDGPPPVALDTDLLADDAHVLAAEALEDHALGGRVDRRRLVAALARADDRLALGAQRQLVEHARDVVPRVAAERVPVGHTGWKSRPDVSFGKKNVDFCGIVSPRVREARHLLDGHRLEQERRRGVAAVDGGDRLVRVRGVGDAVAGRTTRRRAGRSRRRCRRACSGRRGRA